MWTIFGRQSQGAFCDGISRRSFLQIGGSFVGGLSLPQILQAEAIAGTSNSHKAVIFIFLAGGPPHQDMFDLKPDAPEGIRGEFKPISTSIPGIQIGELFPKIAGMMDKFAVIRSLTGAVNEHVSHICYSGFSYAEFGREDRPCVGSVVSQLLGPVDPAVPPFVSTAKKTKGGLWGNPGEAGFLGPAYRPFTPIGRDMTLLEPRISLDRLEGRQVLRAGIDAERRRADKHQGLDTFSQQAFDILTSSKVLKALDLENEPKAIRDRYGYGSLDPVSDGSHREPQHFLAALRLVQAGVRVVTVPFSRWDWHGGNFKRAREDCPMLDNGVSALVEDIHARGLEKDVTVVVWGEFGRTPKINDNAGRDHWPRASCALLAGGGMHVGQVIGSTDKDAADPKDRPVHYQDVMATVYHNLGFNLEETRVYTAFGQPKHVLKEDHLEPVRELI